VTSAAECSGASSERAGEVTAVGSELQLLMEIWMDVFGMGVYNSKREAVPTLLCQHHGLGNNHLWAPEGFPPICRVCSALLCMALGDHRRTNRDSLHCEYTKAVGQDRASSALHASCEREGSCRVLRVTRRDSSRRRLG
jgi:hypothetical protein